MTFGANILIIRKNKNLTQTDLANLIGLGVTKQDISAWENGKHQPQTQEKIEGLARALGVEVSDLYKENLTSETKPEKNEGVDYMNVAIQSLLMTVDSMKQDIKRLEQEVRELRLSGNGQKQGRN